MSENGNQTPAEVLIHATIKSVGKREFLKTVEKMFHIVKRVSTGGQRVKKVIDESKRCHARVKGDRTGMKVGRNVLFEAVQCVRCEIDPLTHLCAIHTNQKEKRGGLELGMYKEELTDAQKQVFGEL